MQAFKENQSLLWDLGRIIAGITIATWVLRIGSTLMGKLAERIFPEASKRVNTRYQNNKNLKKAYDNFVQIALKKFGNYTTTYDRDGNIIELNVRHDRTQSDQQRAWMARHPELTQLFLLLAFFGIINVTRRIFVNLGLMKVENTADSFGYSAVYSLMLGSVSFILHQVLDFLILLSKFFQYIRSVVQLGQRMEAQALQPNIPEPQQALPPALAAPVIMPPSPAPVTPARDEANNKPDADNKAATTPAISPRHRREQVSP